jgi:hypothetical protein
MFATPWNRVCCNGITSTSGFSSLVFSKICSEIFPEVIGGPDPSGAGGGFASGSRRLNLLLPPPLLLLSAAQTTFVPPFLDNDEAVVVIHFW